MTSSETSRSLSAPAWWFIGSIFLVSGAVSLVYQVLWMKELALLFGNTAQATATTLTAFFLGLAVGGWTGGRIAPRLKRPLAAYGWLELAIAASALLYFLLLSTYSRILPSLYTTFGGSPALFVLVKFLLGVVILFPAAMFMGATLPVLGQHVIRSRHRLGRSGSALYALNTLGAGIGAYLAGFHLPLWLGFDRTYQAAIAANLVLGLLVLVASRRMAPPGGSLEAATEGPVAASWITERRIRALAFLTGFTALALEVLWTHMFAQVLHNSVYTFSIILITFLAALAGGSLLAHLISRRSGGGSGILVGLLAAGGVLVALSPTLFSALTGGLRYHADSVGWAGYQVRVFSLAGMVLFLPTLLLGTVFPYLLKLSESTMRSPGRTIGTLVAVNTTAGILGSLAAGFLLLEVVGLWGGIRLVGTIALLGVPIAAHGRPWAKGLPLVPAVLAFAFLALSPAGRPPQLRFDPQTERVLKVWEGSAGIVAVIQDASGLRIKVDNHYGLGGSASREYERRQGLIPLLLHPDPRKVFYLGMGTGITASAAVNPAVEEITICEIVPDAIQAASRYFGPYTDGLFTDPRTRILAEDGRTFLRATSERFDVITSDLFIPWKIGVGSLYSLEHYRTVREHLEPGGLFAQWIPMFQVSRDEFDMIARTMLEVFPLVTVWRGDFNIPTPILCLMGHEANQSLDPRAVTVRLSETPDPGLLMPYDEAEDQLRGFLTAYCGNFSLNRDLVAGAPINTDDRPEIEYRAPITHRQARIDAKPWMVRTELIDFLDALQSGAPPGSDPYLDQLTPVEATYPAMGRLIYRIKVNRSLENHEAADADHQALEALLRQRVGG